MEATTNVIPVATKDAMCYGFSMHKTALSAVKVKINLK